MECGGLRENVEITRRDVSIKCEGSSEERGDFCWVEGGGEGATGIVSGDLGLSRRRSLHEQNNKPSKNEGPLEFLLWHSGFSSVSAALGRRLDLQAQHSGLRIWHCHSSSIGRNCRLNLIPGLGTPYATGQPKKKKKNCDPIWLEIGCVQDSNKLKA